MSGPVPGLVMEAIPGLYVFPFWLLVVAAVAIWGTVRPERDNMRPGQLHKKTPSPSVQ